MEILYEFFCEGKVRNKLIFFSVSLFLIFLLFFSCKKILDEKSKIDCNIKVIIFKA